MIKYKYKSKGSATIITAIFLLVLIAIYFIPTNVVHNENVIAQEIQDDLYLANTSTYKYIDKKLLGNDEQYLIIENPDKALQIFKDKLKHNMQLNSNFETVNNEIIQGKVNIKNFTIYNVQGSTVDIYTVNPYGIFNKSQKDLTKEVVLTPNNYRVTCTTVHSTISLNVKTLEGSNEQDISVDTDIINYKE